jgi:hypothetical protein
MKSSFQSIFTFIALVPLFMMGIQPLAWVHFEPTLISPAPSEQEETLPNTAFHSSPVMFIENAGQFEDSVRYKVFGAGSNIWLTQNAIWMTFLESKPADRSPRPSTPELRRSSHQYGLVKGVNLKLSFVDANPCPKLQPLDHLDTQISYFMGNDPSQWRANLPVWSGVRYQDLYPGIDLELTIEKGEFAWRIVVTDPSLAARRSSLENLQLQLEGADAVTLDGDQLRLTTPVGEYRLPLFQVVGSEELSPPVVVEHRVRSPFVSGKAVPGAQGLLMSPQQSAPYSTFLGGSEHEFAFDIAVDNGGNAYVTGEVYSPDFPVTPGAFETTHHDGFAQDGYDGFIAKLNPTGSSLVYATFIGGNKEDHGYSIAVDDEYNAYVIGNTYSQDFPTTPGAFDTSYNGGLHDAFALKLNPTGSALVYSTYLGGFGDEDGNDIALDGSDNAYLTGCTNANNFPVTTGAFDTTYTGDGSLIDCEAFVAKLNSAGSSLIYATYLGGAETGVDSGSGIVVDGEGNAYVTGGTESPTFPTTAGAYDISYNGGQNDAFVVKFNPSGSALSYATYLGGNGSDGGSGIVLDGTGCSFISIVLDSTDFPTSPDAFQSAFNGGTSDFVILKLNASGSQLIYSTYLGGSDNDYVWGIAIDEMGNAYATGCTISTDFPTTMGAFDTTPNGEEDAFGVKLDPTGSDLTYATYFGGNSDDEGTSIAVDEGETLM